MARGPKKHLKRLAVPSHWMLDKLGGTWAPRPSTGPHKLRECLPLILILRNRLKYALTKREVQLIMMQKHVKVDGKVRTDSNYPAGFMDVVQMEQSDDHFRLLFDIKGRYVLQRLKNADEREYKLCKVMKQALGKGNVPYVATHDARTIRYPHPEIKVGDTVKVNIKTGKIVDYVKQEVGNLIMVTKGRNQGRVGILVHVEKHPGSFDIVQVRDRVGNVFATRRDNIFIIGKGDSPMVTLPKAKGIKISILEEQKRRMQRS